MAHIISIRTGEGTEGQRALQLTILLGLLFSLLCIILYGLQAKAGGLLISTLLLIISAATFMSAMFIGTLFGIPKDNGKTDGLDYLSNNSLSEVADWLTKIIIGVGLVEIKTIPGSVESVGLRVKELLVGCDVTCPGSIVIFVSGTIVFFSAFGIYVGYNNMRLFLAGEYILADRKWKQHQANILNQMANSGVSASNRANAYEGYQQQLTDINGQIGNIDNLGQVKSEMEGENEADGEGEGNAETIAVKDEETPKSNILKFKDFSNLIDRAWQKFDAGQRGQMNIPEHLKDPNKNQWGNKSEVNSRKISASIQSTGKNGGIFQITIKVESTDPARPLANGSVVVFALHNSFPEPIRVVTVKDNIAMLELYSYGAFTVGALADNGNTELELDMAEMKDAPKEFINN